MLLNVLARGVKFHATNGSRLSKFNSFQGAGLACRTTLAKRYLNLQEYQSKQILHENGVQVQRFKVAASELDCERILFPEDHPDAVEGGKDEQVGVTTRSTSTAARQSRWSGFDCDISNAGEFVVKAQVLAGGRGKGSCKKSGQSGVVITNARTSAVQAAQQMLHDHLVTKQTTSEGVLVEKVMIAEAVRLHREFYLAIVLDRTYDTGSILVCSPFGGVDIEEVAERDDTAVRKFTIPVDLELDFDTARRIAIAGFDLNLHDLDIVDQCAREMMKLHQMFMKLDSTQIEINPLGVTNRRKVICVDAKINFDENSRFRHEWWAEIEAMNRSETDARDFAARQHNLNFIGLDGSIGCLVNGAGLAMATMDIIKLHGGEPANFLDVGGSASAQQITEAFRIISSDPRVNAIFVNIFGGIMRCDIVAQGVIQAARELDLRLPIVCRLQGSQVDAARKLIGDQKGVFPIEMNDDLDDAAQLVVSVSRGRSAGKASAPS